MTHFAHPYRPDARGRTAGATEVEHVRQLIEAVIFTAPGERVNRPDFGSGAAQLVFGPASDELAAAARFLVQGALQQHLDHLVDVRDVDVTVHEARVTVQVVYVLRSTGEQHATTVERGL